MNRQTLADVLQDTNQTGSYTLATVLKGAETGSQLLLRDGNAVWQTRNAELLQRQLAVLQACTATGFLTLDGQRVFAERFGAVPQLVVCGGGHVAAALVKQAKLLDLPVLAIDDREEFAQQLRAAGGGFHGFQIAADHLLQHLVRAGHGGGAQRGGAVLAVGAGSRADGFNVAVHEVRAAAAVDVEVDEAGQDVAAGGVRDGGVLRGGFVYGGDAAALDQHGAALADAVREHEPSVADPGSDRIRVHEASLLSDCIEDVHKQEIG